MTPTYHADETYFYDPVAAEKPIRFARKFFVHYEGAFAGKPFTFLTWQEDITRTLFGWKRKDTGLRRFSEMFLLTAKGAGKTPWLSAIGLYMLLADGEPGAHVISCATDFPQAFLTLDMAMNSVKKNRELSRLCKPMQFVIRAPKNSKWTAVSGTAEGKHGFRPSCILADEAHEWPSGKLYNNITANTPKRRQPLTLVATNAGKGEACFAFKLLTRARRAMERPDAEPTLLPVLYEAPDSLDWKSEAAAKAANPSLGHIYGFDALRPKLLVAMQDDEGEREYRRLYCSRWQTTSAGRWLDMDLWKSRQAASLEAFIPPKDAPLYVGVDASQTDDLTAVAAVWPTLERFYARVWFWLPRGTASRYEGSHGIPYAEWADLPGPCIRLTDTATINSEVAAEIVAHIVKLSKAHKLKVVAYDPARADEIIAGVTGAGLTAVPIRQGYTLSSGLWAIDNRLKDGTLVIAPNPVLDFNAENATLRVDDKSNWHLVKPNAKGESHGERAKKVDGLAALADAMAEARKHVFPKARDTWKGQVCRA